MQSLFISYMLGELSRGVCCEVTRQGCRTARKRRQQRVFLVAVKVEVLNCGCNCEIDRQCLCNDILGGGGGGGAFTFWIISSTLAMASATSGSMPLSETAEWSGLLQAAANGLMGEYTGFALALVLESELLRKESSALPSLVGVL